MREAEAWDRAAFRFVILTFIMCDNPERALRVKVRRSVRLSILKYHKDPIATLLGR